MKICAQGGRFVHTGTGDRYLTSVCRGHSSASTFLQPLQLTCGIVVSPPSPSGNEAQSGNAGRLGTVPSGLGMPGEPFEAAAILDEVHGELGLLLWSGVRDVDLWISGAPSERDSLFAAGAEDARRMIIASALQADHRVRQPLEVLAGLLGTAALTATNAEVSGACATLADWASEAGFPRTAFVTALRAASASPRVPTFCLTAGVMARRLADYVRSEAWLRRAAGLARRVGDNHSHALALMHMANLHLLRYEAGPAVLMLQQALGVARRFSLWETRPKVYHDLFRIHATEGDPRQAARYALAAARGYGRFHPRLPALAHDLALFLILQDRPRTALRVLQSLDPGRLRAAERLLVLGSTARAAGATGQVRLYCEIWSEVWMRLDSVQSYDRASEALVNLAWGAAALEDATRLEVAAREALRLALPRDEKQEVLAATQMLECVASGTFPELITRTPGSKEDLQHAVAAAELLLRDLLRCPQVITPDALSDRVEDKPAPGAVDEARGFRKLARLTRATAR